MPFIDTRQPPRPFSSFERDGTSEIMEVTDRTDDGESLHRIQEKSGEKESKRLPSAELRHGSAVPEDAPYEKTYKQDLTLNPKSAVLPSVDLSVWDYSNLRSSRYQDNIPQRSRWSRRRTGFASSHSSKYATRSATKSATTESTETFYSARSQFNVATTDTDVCILHTTQSYVHSSPPQVSSTIAKFDPCRLREGDDYAKLLQSEKLWPVDPMVEQDWSGRGQHAKFDIDETTLINDILELRDSIGSTRTAIVQSVKCRRILLARKTITCGKQTMTKKEAIAEVSHLTRLNHKHIVRVIGTYVRGRELSILLYPAAKYNLEGFFEDFQSTPSYTHPWQWMKISARYLYPCLSSAVRSIHRNLTKHMDIKPQNILVQQMHMGTYYRPYIADFGIARSYERAEDVETDGITSFTRRYAAPEVVRQDLRGLSADIFSLGCVFFETYRTFQDDPEGMQGLSVGAPQVDTKGDTSYQANIAEVQMALETCSGPENLTSREAAMITKMLNAQPQDRPTADDLVSYFGEHLCCVSGGVHLEAIATDASTE